MGTKNPEKKEKTRKCITCGDEISKEEYNNNSGQYDNCVAEDAVYALKAIE